MPLSISLFDKGTQVNHEFESFALFAQNVEIVFGNLAIMVMPSTTVDPWFCVPTFRRVCLYRTNWSGKVQRTKKAWLIPGLPGIAIEQNDAIINFGLRQPGDHGCVSTTLDPWLCALTFR
jgi:hypothetical protein